MSDDGLHPNDGSFTLIMKREWLAPVRSRVLFFKINGGKWWVYGPSHRLPRKQKKLLKKKTSGSFKKWTEDWKRAKVITNL